jgi:thiol-disulfide isomerase/thioredoxin
MLRSFFLLSATLCVAGAARYTLADTPGEVRVGGVLRDAVLKGLNGPSRTLSELRGKPLLINVWASWCGPCRAEMASLERLAWLERSSYFVVIGISTDDYSDRAQAALAESNATISHFIYHDLVLENMLGAAQIPLTVLVDADGRVLQKIHGAREWDSPASLAIIDGAFHPAKAAR